MACVLLEVALSLSQDAWYFVLPASLLTGGSVVGIEDLFQLPIFLHIFIDFICDSRIRQQSGPKMIQNVSPLPYLMF